MRRLTTTSLQGIYSERRWGLPSGSSTTHLKDLPCLRSPLRPARSVWKRIGRMSGILGCSGLWHLPRLCSTTSLTQGSLKLSWCLLTWHDLCHIVCNRGLFEKRKREWKLAARNINTSRNRHRLHELEVNIASWPTLRRELFKAIIF